MNSTGLVTEHFYSKLFSWINEHPEEQREISIDTLMQSVIHDTWRNFEDLKKTNFTTVFEDEEHRRRMMTVDLKYPIVLSNYNRLIDGVHRLFRSLLEQKSTIKTVFIDQSLLSKLSSTSDVIFRPSLVENVSFPDRYISLPHESLPADEQQRRNVIEEYFNDLLPTAKSTPEGYEICLERPSSPYGSYDYDIDIREGLNWWHEGTRIRDIPKEYHLFQGGILALEEQWIPYSWSRTFSRLGRIPDEIILLHLDDHMDMMPPLIGTRIDGQMVDYITGDHISFLKPHSISNAIISGAITRGSILTPLIWSIPKIHVRHLSFRPQCNTTFHLNHVTLSDGILFASNNRLGLHFQDTCWENLQQKSNYVVTSEVKTWLKDLPDGVPILLHLDLDYFNNRFDGNSDWQEHSNRSHDPRFTEQKKSLDRVFDIIQQKKFVDRIIDTSIGISPGFYPAAFWKEMIQAINKNATKIGLNLNLEGANLMEVEPVTQNVKRKAAEKRKGLSDKETLVIPKRVKESHPIQESEVEIDNKYVHSDQVHVRRMASQKFEGWKIEVSGIVCGHVKFINKNDEVFNEHVTVDFKVSKPQQGKHVGRTALTKAIAASKFNLFVAHLRKSNTASKKALIAAGFKDVDYRDNKQLCMIFKKLHPLIP